MTPHDWPAACAHLQHDPIMAGLIGPYPSELQQGKGDAFYTLARSIVGQQISVKAADSVWEKLEKLLKSITPTALLAHDEHHLRQAGLSGQKATYLHNIARYFEEFQPHFDSMDDEQVIAELTRIKGVGRWTAEMFLMFHLLRLDVLPLGDGGLRKSMDQHYHQGKKLSAQAAKEIAEPWRPYRSVATWYLWRAL